MHKKKILSLTLAAGALLAFTANARAGTLTITSGPTYSPAAAFTDTTIQAQVIRPAGVNGDVARLSGKTTVTPGSATETSVTIGGNYSANANDLASAAYSFIVDSNYNGSVTYRLEGTASVPFFGDQRFSAEGSVTRGLNLYKGQFRVPQNFPAAVQGTFTAKLTLRFTPAAAPATTTDAVSPNAPAVGSLAVTIEQFDIQLAPSAATPIASAKLQNVSTRLAVRTGENVLIGGFIVTGNENKRVLIRAIGPSLSERNIAGPLQDPVLSLNDGAIVNDNWKEGGQQTAIEATGAAPKDDREAAIIVDLAPGNHTAAVSGKDGTTGVGLVEVYDLAPSANSQLANLSTRGFVQTGEDVMIAGVIVGPQSTASTALVIRAIGPSLSERGVANPLQNPTLELRDSNANLIASNDDWQQGTDRQTIESYQLAPKNTAESALVAAPSPGTYTAIVRGVQNTTGVGLVEVYRVQ